ncbi:hypothetical protein D3C76_1645430 [compost metagenome]
MDPIGYSHFVHLAVKSVVAVIVNPDIIFHACRFDQECRNGSGIGSILAVPCYAIHRQIDILACSRCFGKSLYGDHSHIIRYMSRQRNVESGKS